VPVQSDSQRYLEDVPAQPRASLIELMFDVSEFAAGLGIFLMALAPLAVPIVALILVPLLAVALVGGLASVAIGLPLMLLVRVARRVRPRPAARELRPDVGAH